MTVASYQFIHLNTYSRTAGKKKGVEAAWDAQGIANEAMRVDGCYSPKIKNPQPPIILHGGDPQQAIDIATTWAETEKDERVQKDGSVRTAKLRKDSPIVMAGIVSMPPDTPVEQWDAYKVDSIEWLKNKYGDRLKSVAEHIDEDNPHFHFYVVPRPGERVYDIHEGLKVHKALAVADPNDYKAANDAYKVAMKAYQDNFFKEVSSKHALTRIGPKRERLSRADWLAVKHAKELEYDAKVKAQADLRMVQVEAKDMFDLKAELTADAARAKADADAAVNEKTKADQALALSRKLQVQAAKDLRTAEIQAAKPALAAQAYIEATLNTAPEQVKKWWALQVAEPLKKVLGIVAGKPYKGLTEKSYKQARLVELEKIATEKDPNLKTILEAKKTTFQNLLKVNRELASRVENGIKGYVSEEDAQAAIVRAVDEEIVVYNSLADNYNKLAEAQDKLQAEMPDIIKSKVEEAVVPLAAEKQELLNQLEGLNEELKSKADEIHKLHVAAGGYFKLDTYTGKTTWVVVEE